MAKLRKYGARSREDRRLSAVKRQEVYDKLSLTEKLERLPINGESKKEIKKLEHIIKFGRKPNVPKTLSSTKKNKHAKPSRRERWDLKNRK